MFIPNDPEYGDETKWLAQVAATKAKYKAARKYVAPFRPIIKTEEAGRYELWSTDAKVIQEQKHIESAIKEYYNILQGRDSASNPCNRCREYPQFNLRNLNTWLCDRCHDVIRDYWPELFKQHCGLQHKELKT